MVCYVIPLITAGMVYAHRKGAGKNDKEGADLVLLLAGGALFGLVDHAWNKQLFPPAGLNIVSDLLLGATITLAIYVFWFATICLSNRKLSQIAVAKVQ